MSYEVEGIKISIEDQSFTGVEQLTGFFLVQAVTERGEPNKAYIIQDEPAFYRELGKPIHFSGKEIVRGLSLGAKFVVFPVHDYTDVTDLNTIVGTLATGTIGAVTFNGKTVGQGYNGIVVSVENPLSGSPNVFDVVTTIAGQTPIRQNNIPNTLTAAVIEQFNSGNPLINIPISEVGDVLTLGTTTLASGSRNINLINNADIIGSSTNNSGIYAFNKDPLNTMRMMNVIKQDTAIDAAYASYAENTLRTVHAFVSPGAVQSAVLSYENNAPKSMNYRLVVGGVAVPDPTNKAVSYASIGAGDTAAAIARKDAEGVFFATAQLKFGQFDSTATDVLVNFFGNAAIASKPVNRIVNDEGLIRLFDNNNTYQDRSSVLRFEDVSDLVILIQRKLKRIAKKYQFAKNNRRELWAPMYRDVRVEMEELVASGAVAGSEGIGWVWNGDQEANNLSELQFNVATDINNGIYKAQLIIIPVAGGRRIEISLVTQSGVTVTTVNS